MSSASHRLRPPALRPDIAPFEIGLVVLVALAMIVPGLWAYTLIDPWEGHYAEVARRMLEERDWVFLRWQDESFQSKPVLTFWLMGASMTLFGIGEAGGYSGEMVSSAMVILSLRLPFALFGVFGLVITWYALAVLASRRVAYLALIVLATSPFYFFVARQAITDMPMVACLMGAVACFALASHESGERPLKPIFRRVAGHYVALAAFSLIVGAQAVYFFVYFLQHPNLAHGVGVPFPHLMLTLPMLAAIGGMWFWCVRLQPIRTRRQLLMLWFYVLIGVSVLAKGPPAVAVAGGTCLLYLLVTGRWRLLLEVEIPRGVLIVIAIALPWHIAMFFKAGIGYYNEYVLYHLFGRAAGEAHGAAGTFNFYASQIGIGMWPWSGLLPAAIAAAFASRLRRPAEHVRLVVALWAIFAVAFISLVGTKFHHYIFPAIPALAILVALFLDDLWAGRIARPFLGCAVGVAIVLLIGRDLVGSQGQLIDLFVYRPGRPWPGDAPWHVDVGGAVVVFAALFAAALAALASRRLRAPALGGLVALAAVWAMWASNHYMRAAAPHWGQGALHHTYYQERAIHGVEIFYDGPREVADDWGEGAGELKVRSVLPQGFEAGQSANVRLHLPGEDDAVALSGTVSRVGDDAFWIDVPEDEREVIREWIEIGRTAAPSRRAPHAHVDADRLLAWNLNWRSENFWSSGEIWGRTAETQTVWDNRKGRDNEAFTEYLHEHGREGQTYFVITHANNTRRLESLLPTRQARQSLEVRDNSCNKFTLLSFTL